MRATPLRHYQPTQWLHRPYHLYGSLVNFWKPAQVPTASPSLRQTKAPVYERNPFYWGETPYFDKVVIKGGGDAITAARSVLKADEADYAWNLQVDPNTLADMEAAGQGSVVSAFSSLVERIVINHTNPDPALGDDRSEYLDGTNSHPFLTFTPITQAMSMAIDRSTNLRPTLRLRCQACL